MQPSLQAEETPAQPAGAVSLRVINRLKGTGKHLTSDGHGSWCDIRHCPYSLPARWATALGLCAHMQGLFHCSRLSGFAFLLVPGTQACQGVIRAVQGSPSPLLAI